MFITNQLSGRFALSTLQPFIVDVFDGHVNSASHLSDSVVSQFVLLTSSDGRLGDRLTEFGVGGLTVQEYQMFSSR